MACDRVRDHFAEAAIHIDDVGGDTGSQVGQHERGGIADIFNGDVAADRCRSSEGAQQLAKILDAAGRQRFDRAG